MGGWPYGHNSLCIDLTGQYIKSDNQLAIRVKNPISRSSRWYPSAGHCKVWITKVGKTHTRHLETHITSGNVSSESAMIEIDVKVTSTSGSRHGPISIQTDVFENDLRSSARGLKVASIPKRTILSGSSNSYKAATSVGLHNPNSLDRHLRSHHSYTMLSHVDLMVRYC